MELIVGFVLTAAVFALAWYSKACRPFFAALWLCIFCLVGDVLAIGLVLSPQGQDFLFALRDYGGRSSTYLQQFWFFSSLTILAFCNWACGRALMYRLGMGMPQWIVVWVPRAFGLAPLLAVLGVFALRFRAWGFVYITLALTVIYLVLVVGRRWAVRYMVRASMSLHGPEVSLGMKITLGASLFVSFVLFTLFWIDPVRYPQALGAPSIALLAVTSWVLFGSVVLVLFPRTRGWPSLAWLPVALAMVSSWSNENYRVREIEAPAQAAQTAPAPRATTMAGDLQDWFAQRQLDPRKPYPVFIVAAEGGGVRAAYWTASVLARLQSADPRFAQHVYAISGVSGGSLGGATFVALLQAQRRNQLAPCMNPDSDQPPALLYDCAQAFLANDFMSPALAYLLYEDLVQRLLFVPIPALSRAKALEQAWERGWAEKTNTNLFAEPFSGLWAGDTKREIPELFLNGTIVESGSRIITSNVPIRSDDFPDAFGTFDEPALNPTDAPPFSARLPVSTAVHMSARFTYVSPPGRLLDSIGETWGHVIDGGYFENSGAATATDIYWRVFRARRQLQRNILPVYVLITNSPDSLAVGNGVVGKPVEPIEFLADLGSPPLGLLNTREARGRYALSRIRTDDPTAVTRRCVINFGLREAQAGGHNPILGWFLARESRQEMRGQLQRLESEVQRVRRLLETGECR